MTAVIAVLAVTAVACSSALFVHRSRSRSRRRLEKLVRELDLALGAIVRTLEGALQRAEGGPGTSRDLGLTLDLDDMLMRIAREAATRTGAEAAAVRVRGPADEPAVASFGDESVAALLETTVRPGQGRPFRAVTINWTFPPVLETEAAEQPFRSALVVPLVEDGVETGAIAGYATEPSAFRPEHARALEALAAEAAEGVATARRFTAFRRRDRLARA
jgi:GAF domain-containing protein